MSFLAEPGSAPPLFPAMMRSNRAYPSSLFVPDEGSADSCSDFETPLEVTNESALSYGAFDDYFSTAESLEEWLSFDRSRIEFTPLLGF